MNQAPQFWYVVKQQDQTCQIVSFATEQTKTPEQKQWGHYLSEQEAMQRGLGGFPAEPKAQVAPSDASALCAVQRLHQEAIAKKIGLIRAGKCKPE